MEDLRGLVFSQLGIPTWQILVFIGLNSFFMLSRRTRFCLMATYLLGLYWSFHIFRAYWLSAAQGDLLVLTAYILFALTLVGLSAYPFFFNERRHLPGFSSYEIGRLQRTLLKRMDRMEAAVLEAETRAVRDIQQFEGLRQEIETRMGPLEGQVCKIGEVLEQKEGTVQGLEKGLLAQLRDLENQLGEKEELLRSRDREIQDIRSEMEDKSARLVAQIETGEERIKQESSRKETEENLHAEVGEMQRQLAEKEALLLERNKEIKELRSEIEAAAGAVDGELQGLKAELAGRESWFKEREEALAANVRGLEEQLREREARLEARDQEIQNLRSDLDAKVVRLQDQILEKERETGKQESSFAGAAKKLNGKILDLEGQLGEKESALQAREISFQEREEGLVARIRDLENQLSEDERGQTHASVVQSLAPEMEVKITSLHALLKEQEESFARRAASYTEVVESLTARIHELEGQLKETAGFSDLHNKETRKRRDQGLVPREAPEQPAADLRDDVDAALERIRTGLREGERPWRPGGRGLK